MEENNNDINNAPEKQGSNGLSIASMVLGLVGLLVFALPCGILAVIFSVMGKKNGFATTGLVLGIIDAVFGAIAILIQLLMLV